MASICLPQLFSVSSLLKASSRHKMMMFNPKELWLLARWLKYLLNKFLFQQGTLLDTKNGFRSKPKPIFIYSNAFRLCYNHKRMEKYFFLCKRDAVKVTKQINSV